MNYNGTLVVEHDSFQDYPQLLKKYCLDRLGQPFGHVQIASAVIRVCSVFISLTHV